MSKGGFVKRHSYLLTAGAIAGFIIMKQCDSPKTDTESEKSSKRLIPIEKTSKQAPNRLGVDRHLADQPQDSHAAGQSTGSPGLPAALLPKLTIGPWIINGAVASAFVGQWSGTVIQTGSVSDQYPVGITIRSGQSNQRLGAIDYPTLGCSGELILSAASSAQIIVEESLTRGLAACTNHTKVTLTLNADGTLDYSARVSTISGSAVLRKAN